MKTKFFAALVAFAFVLNAFVGTAFADTKTARKAKPVNSLAALLPTSDGILTIDTQRLLSEVVPQILSAKPQTITDINNFLDEIKTKAGVDLRQFEQLAIGISMKQFSDEGFDLEPVILARGKNNANGLIALAKLAANGKYREEKIGVRTVYVFTVEPPKEMKSTEPPATSDTGDQPVAPPKKDSWLDKGIERTIDNFFKELAVTSYDNNTLVVGSPVRVRDTLTAKVRGNAALLGSINRKPNAVAAFSANLPNGLGDLIELDNDQIGKTINSIRQISGAMELISGDTAVSATAKTVRIEDAQNLLETLQGLQMFGKSLLGGSKAADKQVYSRMIDNAKFTRTQTTVALDLQVLQSDINILLGAK